MGQLNYTTEKTNELLAKVESLPEQVAEGSNIVLETGETTTLEPGQSATSEVVDNGVDDEGKHKYKLNFGIPKGAGGTNGKTPVLEAGKTTTLAAGQSATAEVVANGTDTAGNPKYKLNFGIPKGVDGSGGSGGGGAVDITDIMTASSDSDTPTISMENYNKLKELIESGTPMYVKQNDVVYPIVGVMQGAMFLYQLAPYGMSGFMFIQFQIDANLSISSYESLIPSIIYVCNGNMTGYAKPSKYSAITDSLSIKDAIGNLEAGLNALQESGGSGSSGESDVYVLPGNLASLKSDATNEEIVEAFGGTDKIEEIINLVTGDSIVRFVISTKPYFIYNVDVFSLLGTNIRILFFDAQYGYIHIIKIGKSGSNGSVQIIYPGGYTLKSEVLKLNTSSTSEEISTAVGGESGIKEIVNAIKDGNHIKVYGLSDSTNEYSYVLSFGYQVKETDTELGFTVNLLGGVFGVKYNKSTQTFTYIDSTTDIN